MHFRFPIIWFSLVLTLVFPAFSEWDTSVIQHGLSFSTPYKDSFFASIAGTCGLKNIPYEEMSVKVEQKKVPTLGMVMGTLGIDIGLQRDKVGRIVKAPLAIFIPGSFVNLGERQPNRWMDALTRMGYHTLVLPNPLGTDFISKIPVEKWGSFTPEAETLYGVIRRMHSQLSRRGVLSGVVRIAGVSSGGFFTSIIIALDAEHRDPIINSDATIVAPGFHLGRGMDRLDGFVEELRQDFQEMSSLRLLYKLRKICRVKDPLNAGQNILRDSKGIVSFAGFYEELVSSVKRYDSVKRLNKVPKNPFPWTNEAYKEWRDQLKFAKYYADFNPEGQVIIRSKKGHLYYWLDRAYNAGFPSVRILTTIDDFFNDPGAWSPLESNPLRTGMGGVYDLMLDPTAWDKIQKDLIVLDHGGHYGFRNTPWFKIFLDLAFSFDRSTHPRRENFDSLYSETNKTHPK
jgi:hypothetical protein